MYKEIKLKISENAINEMRSQIITAGICSRSLLASEQTIMFIIKAIEKDNNEVTIDLKCDLKKKRVKKKQTKKKKKT